MNQLQNTSDFVWSRSVFLMACAQLPAGKPLRDNDATLSLERWTFYRQNCLTLFNLAM